MATGRVNTERLTCFNIDKPGAAPPSETVTGRKFYFGTLVLWHLWKKDMFAELERGSCRRYKGSQKQQTPAKARV